MALNVVFSDIRSERRARPVGNNVAPGTPIFSGGQPAVTLTGSRDYDGNEVTINANGQTLVVAGGRGGESLPADNYATITFSGTYEFPVIGATSATTPGTLVYREADGDLTLTSAGNTVWGRVEFSTAVTGAPTLTAVTIGA